MLIFWNLEYNNEYNSTSYGALQLMTSQTHYIALPNVNLILTCAQTLTYSASVI